MHYLAMFIALYCTNDRLIDPVRQLDSSPFLYRPITSLNPNPEPKSQLLSLFQELPFSI